MLRLFLNLLFILLVVVATSCFKEDEIIIPHSPGDFITDTVTLTESYKYQVYYSLHDSSEMGTSLKDLWDLGFESTPRGWRVILNTACFMKSAYLSNQVFGSQADTTGALWLFNPSDGSADSIAIGQWFVIDNNDTIGVDRLIIIDRGIDFNGKPRGFCQLVVDSLVKGRYYFRIADLDGTNPHSYSINKNGEVNHVLFSVSDPSLVITEPKSFSWDLLFTQYTTLLYTDVGDPYPYLVTGVLINPAAFVEVAVDSVTPFGEITFEQVQNMTFSKQADRIGYNWKYYDFDEGTYTVNPDIIYIIRDVRGFLYKLRFIGFYKYHNNKLEKGFPSFEYQKL